MLESTIRSFESVEGKETGSMAQSISDRMVHQASQRKPDVDSPMRGRERLPVRPLQNKGETDAVPE